MSEFQFNSLPLFENQFMSVLILINFDNNMFYWFRYVASNYLSVFDCNVPGYVHHLEYVKNQTTAPASSVGQWSLSECPTYFHNGNPEVYHAKRTQIRMISSVCVT